MKSQAMCATIRLKSKRGVLRLRPGHKSTTYTYMIVGAGCAGLSLAWNLIDAGITAPILIVDQRSTFVNDRTWCFWDIEPTPFSDLATHHWSNWMIHDGEREIIATCPDYPYLRIRSADFYRRVLARLTAAPNITWALGKPVLEVRDTSRGVRVSTSVGHFNGVCAFNSITPKPQAPQVGPHHRPVSLLQHFLGQTIRVNKPTFDPLTPTLMDFRTSQADGPHFVYVLPLSETEALVENTYLYSFSLPREKHRQEICQYLNMRYGLDARSYTVIEEEAGAIPMSMARNAREIASRVTAIGLAGGAARPSSGYAFLRIQRQAQLIAQGIAVPGNASSTQGQCRLRAFKYQFFDTVFLQCLADRPDLAARIFGQMFHRADPAALVRFLGDQSTLCDDLRIISALPKTPFLAAALRSCPDWFPARF